MDQLSELTGYSVSFLSRMESGKRNITMTGLQKMASAIGMQPSEIVADLGEIEDADDEVARASATARMPIMGEVRAGAWLEIDSDVEPMGHIPFSTDQRYRGQRQFALKVVGTSMNLVAKPGIFVVVADWTDNGADLKHDDLVVVRRERAHTYEVTLKKARKVGDAWELWPESDDPKHQEPIRLKDENPEWAVVIVGKVIGKYEPL